MYKVRTKNGLNIKEEKTMSRYYYALALITFLFYVGIAGAQGSQYPLMEKIAQKVIQKYQTSSCEQLAMEKSQPPSQMTQQAIQQLRADPQMRTAFINIVAAPIANKLFDCGMIP